MTYGFVKNRIFQKKTGKLDQKKFIQYTHLNKGQVSKALKGLKNKNIILENPKGVYSINSRPFGIDPETLKSVKE